jgi:putative transcriptional regulator
LPGICGPELRAAHIFAILRTTLHNNSAKMIRCHLSTLMGRDKLRISDVAKSTGLNRSTVTALYNETATRVELPAIESLCQLFRCQVGELFEIVPSGSEVKP